MEFLKLKIKNPDNCKNNFIYKNRKDKDILRLADFNSKIVMNKLFQEWHLTKN